MANVEKCQECGFSFKHHELIQHRRLHGHFKFPLKNVAIKEALHNAKRDRIEKKG